MCHVQVRRTQSPMAMWRWRFPALSRWRSPTGEHLPISIDWEFVFHVFQTINFVPRSSKLQMFWFRTSTSFWKETFHVARLNVQDPKPQCDVAMGVPSTEQAEETDHRRFASLLSFGVCVCAFHVFKTLNFGSRCSTMSFLLCRNWKSAMLI